MSLPPRRRRRTLARARASGLSALVLAVGVLLLAAAVGAGLWTGDGPGSPRTGSAAGAPMRSERGTLRRLGTTGLTLRVLSSSTATRIVNEYLPPLEPNGVFLLVDVAASNATNQTALLASGQLGLWLAGVRYPVDAAALAALELAGHRALAGSALAAGATTSGWLVFDVPVAAAGSTPVVCLAGANGSAAGGDGCE